MQFGIGRPEKSIAQALWALICVQVLRMHNANADLQRQIGFLAGITRYNWNLRQSTPGQDRTGDLQRVRLTS